MWKKTVPITAALTTLLLAGCNMNNDVPDTNETPMEDVKKDVREDANDLIPNPKVNTESPVETNEGIYDNGKLDKNGTETNDRNTDEDKDMNKDTNTPNEDIIEDDLDMNDKDNVDK